MSSLGPLCLSPMSMQVDQLPAAGLWPVSPSSDCCTARNAPVLMVPLLLPFLGPRARRRCLGRVPGSAASPSMPPGRPPTRQQPRHPRSYQCDPPREGTAIFHQECEVFGLGQPFLMEPESLLTDPSTRTSGIDIIKRSIRRYCPTAL